ncbi:MAG: PP2C family protein-serine/threonine phosphatase [Bacillota bacterium]
MADSLYCGKQLHIEVAASQLRKAGEELCGDSFSITRTNASTIIIVSDGLGSGVKANILSSLTTRMAATMLKEGSKVDAVIDVLANTLPVCKVRDLAYSTFTIAQIKWDEGQVYLAEYDNPPVMLIRKKQPVCLKKTETVIGERVIQEANFTIENGDWMVLLTDGVLHAGIGGVWNLGWGWDRVEGYIRNIACADMTAEELATEVLGLCDKLYAGKPGDDATVVVVKARLPKYLTALVGPPVNPEQDREVARRLCEREGVKVVCGGTTAQMVARITGKKLKVDLTSLAGSVPPVAEIEGIDLTTEGMLTLAETRSILVRSGSARALKGKRDGASRLAAALMDADNVHFIVGRAINPAHQSPDIPVTLAMKHQIVESIIDLLRQKGKEVTAEYF